MLKASFLFCFYLSSWYNGDAYVGFKKAKLRKQTFFVFAHTVAQASFCNPQQDPPKRSLLLLVLLRRPRLPALDVFALAPRAAVVVVCGNCSWEGRRDVPKSHADVWN